MKTITPKNITAKMSAGIAIMMLAMAAQSVEAGNITYSYTGNPFNDVMGSFTTSDFVSGWFTLATPLPDNLILANSILVTPIAFSFTDGVDTITNLTPTSIAPVFDIEGTDSNGDITQWFIDLESSPTTFPQVTTGNQLLGAYDQGVLNQTNNGLVYSDAGTWTVSPEPTSLVLIPSGLLALAFLSRKRKVLGHRPSHN